MSAWRMTLTLLFVGNNVAELSTDYFSERTYLKRERNRSGPGAFAVSGFLFCTFYLL